MFQKPREGNSRTMQSIVINTTEEPPFQTGCQGQLGAGPQISLCCPLQGKTKHLPLVASKLIQRENDYIWVLTISYYQRKEYKLVPSFWANGKSVISRPRSCKELSQWQPSLLLVHRREKTPLRRWLELQASDLLLLGWNTNLRGKKIS